MNIREQIEKVIRDESGSYQLMVGKMRAIDLDRCEEAFIDKLLSLISEEKESEWVSVEDRLPKEKWGEATVKLVYPHCVKAWYASDWKKWCKTGSRDILDTQPTHWMPLPQPPKSEEEKWMLKILEYVFVTCYCIGFALGIFALIFNALTE